jgi:hypothetical protein
MSSVQSSSNVEGDDGAAISVPSLPNEPLPSVVDSTPMNANGLSGHIQKVTDSADAYSLISIQTATPDELAQAKEYYSNIQFALQLCHDVASAESGNPEFSAPLTEARKVLGCIVEHNAHLKSSPPGFQPACPRHAALIRFDIPLQRLTTQWLVIKKWKMHFVVLRGMRLYIYSNDKGGCFCSNNSVYSAHESQEGAMALVQANAAPDGDCCLNLKGALARSTTHAMFGFAANVCDAYAQAAALRVAAHPSMDRPLPSRSSFLEALRCSNTRTCLRDRVTSHTDCMINRKFALLLPMMSRDNSALASSKLLPRTA